jgi:micrococcal nuclease
LVKSSSATQASIEIRTHVISFDLKGGALARRRKRVPSVAVLLLGVIGYVLNHFGILDKFKQPSVQADPNGSIRVVRVVDGDTLVLEGNEKVRLIGVDTPETKHPTKPIEPFGPEASAFTKKTVEGRLVQLKYDKNKRDRYQRLLAYVYIGDWCLNEELIRAGFSKCETKYPFDKTLQRQFKVAESEAKAGRRGIWSGNRSRIAVR